MTSPKARVSGAWFVGIQQPDIRKKFEEALRIQIEGPVFKRLRQILAQELETIERQEATTKNYADASWAYLQAHRNGQKETLKLVEDLLTARITETE